MRLLPPICVCSGLMQRQEVNPDVRFYQPRSMVFHIAAVSARREATNVTIASGDAIGLEATQNVQKEGMEERHSRGPAMMMKTKTDYRCRGLRKHSCQAGRGTRPRANRAQIAS